MHSGKLEVKLDSKETAKKEISTKCWNRHRRFGKSYPGRATVAVTVKRLTTYLWIVNYDKSL